MGKRVITINRQFGSNGRRIGAKLADKLGIHFYDRELIKLASEQMDIPYEQLKLVDEKREKPWSYQVDLNPALDRRYRYEHIDEQLFDTQSEVILKAAQNEDCIIVGRCADYVLKGWPTSKHIFLYAPYNVRLKTVMDRYSLDAAAAEHLMRKVDKDRSYYYNYYTDQRWNDFINYDLCLNTDSFTEDELIDYLVEIYNSIKES